jgi:1,4-alpha-glucan branching enzyme
VEPAGQATAVHGLRVRQESEWSDGRSLDWWLLDQPLHYRIHAQVKEMNAIYRANPALWALDHDPAGFRWLNADNAAANTFSYLRFGDKELGADGPVLAAVVNFSGQTHEPYRVGVPRGGSVEGRPRHGRLLPRCPLVGRRRHRRR